MSYDVWLTVTETHALTTRVEAKSIEEAQAKVEEAMEKCAEGGISVVELEVDGRTVPVDYADFVSDDFEIVQVCEAAEVTA